MKKENFGEFLGRMASKDEGAGNDTLKELRKEFEAERQRQVADKLRAVFRQIQVEVASLQRIRRSEKAQLQIIKALEKKAQDVVDGKDIEDVQSLGQMMRERIR
jgi:hypothetical protein